MNKKLTFVIFTTFFVTIVTFLSFQWWKTNSSFVSDNSDPVNFVVAKGKSATEIGNKLYDAGLIKSPLAFKIYVQLLGKQKSINAGQFSLSQNMGLIEVVEALGKGPIQLWVTIPEGLRREELPEIFIEAFSMGGKQADTFREEFIDFSKNKEGKLFPDTYLFPKDISASVVIKTMNTNFQKKVVSITKRRMIEEYSLDELVALAAIVERETKTASERPIVAGIFFNRLSMGMGLQADATVQYALANLRCVDKVNCSNWWPKVLSEDYKINSIYNTYLSAGIPPSAIASPGLLSLSAVFDPKKSNYLYYIHDLNGDIHYARDLAGHNQNVHKYLR